MGNVCPVCLKASLQPFSDQEWNFGGRAYHLVQCTACGSAHTTTLPNDTLLTKLYATSFNYHWYQDHYPAKLKDSRMRLKEYKALLGNRILDFGGGLGYFSQAAREAGYQSLTYDPYTTGVPAEGRAWDTVVALHVLEHSNNPDRTVNQIKNLLAPGGRIIIAVPNASGLGYQKLGMRWVWAQPPLIHIFHFTAAGLTALFSRHGFVDIQVSYHERWDANLYCDLEHAERFRKWDAAWGFRPLYQLQLYRKLVANINSNKRFKGLEKSHLSTRGNSTDCSELQITARLGT